MRFTDFMIRARDRVRGFDKIEGSEDRSLETIAIALESGLKNPETEAQFDALWMLKDLLIKTKQISEASNDR